MAFTWSMHCGRTHRACYNEMIKIDDLKCSATFHRKWLRLHLHFFGETDKLPMSSGLGAQRQRSPVNDAYFVRAAIGSVSGTINLRRAQLSWRMFHLCVRVL